MLYNMIRTSATGQVAAPETEMSATSTKTLTAPFIVTKRPLDLFQVPKIVRRFGNRDLWFVASYRDPRDLVSSKHKSVPQQFFQGVDYQFFISGETKSYGYPGLAACFEELARLRNASDQRILFARYEDTVRDPENLRSILRFATGLPLERPFSDFHMSVLPENLTNALNGIRPVEISDVPAWTHPERLKRVCQQIQLFPEIETFAQDWGYDPFEQVVENLNLTLPDIPSPRGTIVAFHTDDPLYRAEAARFLKSVDKLGLKIDMKVIPPKADWVANCAMKPEIIADARRRIDGPLLYVDVDAIIHADPWPYLSQYDGDLAANVLVNGKLNSGTLYIADTQAAHKAVEEWVQRQRKNPQVWDQDTLRNIVEEIQHSTDPRFRFQRLPHNLCHIFDCSYPHTYGPVLIEHLQASRSNESKWSRKKARKLERSRLIRIKELEHLR